MAEIVVMCGLPGAGKSTYVKEHYPEYVYLSSDEIREELKTTSYTKEDNIFVFDILYNRMNEAVKYKKNIVVDATNVKRKDRLCFLAKIYKWDPTYKKILVWILLSRDKCVENDAKRPNPVGAEVIDRMYHRFDIPAMYEGWNDIKVEVTPDPDLVQFYKDADMDHFNQHNKHHRYTLGKHMAKTGKYIMARDLKDVNLANAAIFHDIGKVKTQSFVNAKGEVTEDAHYYNHHHVGAYDLAIYLSTVGEFRMVDILDTCDLVNMHMEPIITWPNSKRSFNLYMGLAGKQQLYRVLLLSEADQASC